MLEHADTTEILGRLRASVAALLPGQVGPGLRYQVSTESPTGFARYPTFTSEEADGVRHGLLYLWFTELDEQGLESQLVTVMLVENPGRYGSSFSLRVYDRFDSLVWAVQDRPTADFDADDVLHTAYRVALVLAMQDKLLPNDYVQTDGFIPWCSMLRRRTDMHDVVACMVDHLFVRVLGFQVSVETQWPQIMSRSEFRSTWVVTGVRNSVTCSFSIRPTRRGTSLALSAEENQDAGFSLGYELRGTARHATKDVDVLLALSIAEQGLAAIPMAMMTFAMWMLANTFEHAKAAVFLGEGFAERF